MVGIYMIYLFRGDFLASYYTCIIFKKGKILYVRDIDFKVTHMHMVPGSNNECTPCAQATHPQFGYRSPSNTYI